MASFYSNTSIEIKKFIRASVSWNIIKAFFCEKTRNFIRVSKSIINLSWWSSFIFKAWAEKCRVPFPKYKKDFLLRKYGDFFFILEIESSVSGNINKHQNVFNIWARKLRFGKYICIIYIWKWNCSMKKSLKNLVKRACN